MKTPTRRPTALVFDLDGTLIDSRRDIATAVNRMRGEQGLPPLALEQVVGMVGEGARVLVVRALGGGEIAEERLGAALASYLAHYEEVCLDDTHAYPGVPEMLGDLAEVYPLAVLSNKGEAVSKRILEALGLAPRFRIILGGDSLPIRKPDPAGLRLLAKRLGVQVEELMLIGDSRIDAETARAASCQFALVEWGFPRRSSLEGIPADLRGKEPIEITTALLAVR
ncbi:MAG TPA: HAD-IA family hydrolase [Thermoanaerobaculia bacterium]|nr:HAD-IA family hydrolase [Thermoanaerobaculia bacterium]